MFEQNTRSKPWLAMECVARSLVTPPAATLWIRFDHSVTDELVLGRWNDGSTLETPGAPEDEPQDPSSTLAPTEPLEPFLLAGDPDLEDEVHHSDPKGELYLRPYSRVYLAEKWNVLGVPNVVVYHLPSRQILTHHARFDLLKDGKLESTWAKWSEGEKVEFGIGGEQALSPEAACV